MPVAHISLIDEVGAVAEVARAREAGCRAVYLSPDMEARGGRVLNDPAFDPFWAAAADLDMPVGFHVVVRDQPGVPAADAQAAAPAASCSSSPSWPST